MYVFWRKTEDPPSPWTRLTRTNRYLRFDSDTNNHWNSVGSSTHNHSSISSVQLSNSVHTAPHLVSNYYKDYNVLTTHNHSVTNISNTSSNNNPIGFGLDIIYMDLDTWESSVLSFPEGTIIMSNGVLVDANLERYTVAEGKFIVHAIPETTIGTTTPHGHTVSGSSGFATGGTGSLAGYSTDGCDIATSHTHNFSFVSEAKYVEPKKLLTRLYKVLAETSKTVAGSVVFVDGSVSANWEILTDWASGNLYAYDCNPALTGSDVHEHTFSGNSIEYDGSDQLSYYTYLNQTAYDSHYHVVSGNLDNNEHIPASKKIIPARLLYDLQKSTESVLVIMT
ncbi:MAG: hypothetical protein WC929_07500 [Bacilli bacterium]